MDRIWKKVKKTRGCWNWVGSINNKGYGETYLNGKKCGAHRVIYELSGKIIPKGLELDHLCRNRKCVNPKHLEPVTHAENMIRSIPFLKPKLYCKKGHKRTEESIVKKRYEGYGLVCRICKNQRQIEYTARKKLKIKAHH